MQGLLEKRLGQDWVAREPQALSIFILASWSRRDGRRAVLSSFFALFGVRQCFALPLWFLLLVFISWSSGTREKQKTKDQSKAAEAKPLPHSKKGKNRPEMNDIKNKNSNTYVKSRYRNGRKEGWRQEGTERNSWGQLLPFREIEKNRPSIFADASIWNVFEREGLAKRVASEPGGKSALSGQGRSLLGA